MATQPTPDQGHEVLVDVFETMEETEALVVKGLLESSGIPALLSGLDAPPDVLPGVGGIAVRVPSEHAEEARRLIASRFDSNPQGPETPQHPDSIVEDDVA
ncbi:MAG: DUF2007 domain-containing protein [Candidatus Korobacteraceae bacterium]